MDEDVAQIKDILRQPLETGGYFLESVKAVAAGQRRAVTVVIDLDDSSTEAMSMDKIAGASQIVNEALDDVEIFRDKPYQLEVTSPGATRKLELPRHFRRVLGRRLEIETKQHKFRLDLEEVGDTVISGRDPDERETKTVALAGIVKAQVELKFRKA